MRIANGVRRIECVKKNITKRWNRKAVIPMDMVTCKYCGIVPRGHLCPHRKSRVKQGDKQSERFRKTKSWTDKSIEIRHRDKYLCRVCLADLYHTMNWLNYKGVEVHHICPINEDYNRRLDNDNLISLCSYHHHMADNGEIPREVLYDLVEKSTEK